MLSENIKNYRKAKGFSQKTLAQELNVVRQTVSKWEKGFSVPDADMLIRLSEVLDVSVTVLLGDKGNDESIKTDTAQIASQLYILNNQFANELYRKKRLRKRLRIVLVVVLLLIVLAVSLAVVSFNMYSFNADEAGDISAVTVVSVRSELFEQSDIDSAVEAVKEVFVKEFNGCRLIEIKYAGDEKSKSEFNYYNNSNDDFDDMIVLTSSFYVGKHGGDGSFNTDFQYDDWNWMLGRKNGGEWKMLGYGYA